MIDNKYISHIAHEIINILSKINYDVEIKIDNIDQWNNKYDKRILKGLILLSYHWNGSRRISCFEYEQIIRCVYYVLDGKWELMEEPYTNFEDKGGQEVVLIENLYHAYVLTLIFNNKLESNINEIIDRFYNVVV